MRLLLIGIFIILATSFKAGSASSFLKCKSESGRTLFEAEIQDIDGALVQATFSIDSSSITFDQSSQSSIVFDSKLGVYTIELQNIGNKGKGYQYITFYAIPETFKRIKSSKYDDEYHFEAYIRATEPRDSITYPVGKIKLNCVLTYSI